ncbi:hypothetical protein ACFXA0_03420 [Streptomyces cyaneofuscatus]|nr:hypothetical protein [Streptomyces sp. SID2119]
MIKIAGHHPAEGHRAVLRDLLAALVVRMGNMPPKLLDWTSPYG